LRWEKVERCLGRLLGVPFWIVGILRYDGQTLNGAVLELDTSKRVRKQNGLSTNFGNACEQYQHQGPLPTSF
jgi:hypothetical protein